MSKKIYFKQPMKYWRIAACVFPAIMTIIGAVLLNLYPLLGNLRWMIIVILVVLYLLITATLLRFYQKKSTKGQIFCIVLAMLLGLVVTACDYIYFRAINTMDAISTSAGDIVTSVVYVHADDPYDELKDLKDKSIAVQPATSVTMYEMLIEGIEKEELTAEDFVLEIYTSYIDAFEAFQNGQVDAIILDAQALESIQDIYPEFESQTKSVATFKKIVQLESSNIDVSKEPFTVLINGVDIRSGNLNQAANADVIMLATFNPQTMKLSLNSIPRDTYLYVTCRGFSDKITHSGVGGVQCTIDSLEQALDINIDYYIKVNFFAVVDLVDALGGIEVDVPFSFTEQDEHDTKGAIHLEEGLQTLNGSEALALCRHRKTLPRGDIDRGLNQQLVIEAILKKVASSSSVLSVDKLLNVVGDNVQTNMPTSQMYGLFRMLTNLGSSSKYGNLSALSIQMETIDGEGAMFPPEYTSQSLYFYLPYQYSLENTTRDINRILGLEKYPVPTNTFAFNANVAYEDISEDSIYYMDNDIGSTSYALPETPTQPIESYDPVEEEPTEPAESNEEPIENPDPDPEDPVDPIEPEEPEVPVDPVDPGESENPFDPELPEMPDFSSIFPGNNTH